MTQSFAARLSNFTLLSVAAFTLITGFAFEAMATTNAMPAVIAQLGSDTWYSLAAGVVLAGQIFTTVFAGWLSDRLGVARPLLFGVAGFMLGSLLAGLAPNLLVFVAARFLQGLGIGFTIVPLYVMIGALIEAEDRPKLFASFSYAWVVPSMVGPALAGFVVNTWHWRPVFLMVLPLAFFGTIPLFPLLRRMPAKEDYLSEGDSAPEHRPPLLPTMALSGSIALMQFAGGTSGYWTFGIGIFAVMLFLYGMIWLFPKATFRAATGVASMYATRFLLMAAMIGTEFFIPLILNREHGWDLQQTGWVLTLGTITWTLGSYIQSRVKPMQARLKLPFIGAILVFVGNLSLIGLAFANLSVYPSLVGWGLIGLGMGVMTSTISDLSLAVTPFKHHGDVSSKLQLADATGPAVATGLFGLALGIWGNFIADAKLSLPAYLPAPLLASVIALLGVYAAWQNRNLVVPTRGRKE
ncbi:MFS transporter [Gleimia sp. 6138-11-ORH1]|uniref:MFS transporter n=1 Tax=Gleimia sp. 6138-11-ORH1 TaxID=2973937 RepID=UPI0021697970|nr:MFS transporter [Gleimia sp. 6138-11-ORH1]MCS4484399.1 MFS transporter [Gleimia sp. 6138-11-ORH1]